MSSLLAETGCKVQQTFISVIVTPDLWKSPIGGDSIVGRVKKGRSRTWPGHWIRRWLRKCNRGISLEEWVQPLLLYLLRYYVSTINTFSEWPERECEELSFWCYFQHNGSMLQMTFWGVPQSSLPSPHMLCYLTFFHYEWLKVTNKFL